MRRLAALILPMVLGAVVLPGCLDYGALAGIFCDYAGTGACDGPEYFTCGETRCADEPEYGSCAARFECSETGSCIRVELKPGYVESKCMLNLCNDGSWTQMPRPEIDDGDPCTEDSCDESTGKIVHHDICP